MSADLDGLRAAAMGAPEQTVTDVNVTGVWLGSRHHLTVRPDVVLALIARVEAKVAVSVDRIRDAIRQHIPFDRYDDDGEATGTSCICGDWTGDYFADGGAGPFDDHLAQMVAEALEASSDDAGSPVRPADGLSGPEAGRDGEGL